MVAKSVFRKGAGQLETFTLQSESLGQLAGRNCLPDSSSSGRFAGGFWGREGNSLFKSE